MSASFHNADKPTHRRIIVVASLSCAVFIAIGWWANLPASSDRVLLKADRLVHTAGQPVQVN